MKLALKLLFFFVIVNCSAQPYKTFSIDLEVFLSSKIGSKTIDEQTSSNIYMKANNGLGYSVKILRNIQYNKLGYYYGLGYSNFGLAYSYVSNEGFKTNNWQNANSFKSTKVRWNNMFSSFSVHLGLTRTKDLNHLSKICVSMGLGVEYFEVGTSGVISSHLINNGNQAISLFSASVDVNNNSNIQGGGELNISYLKKTKRKRLWLKYGLNYEFLVTPPVLESEMILYGDDTNLVQNVKSNISTVGVRLGLVF